MSLDEAPQYIVTTPGDGGDDATSATAAAAASKVIVTSRSMTQSSRSHSLQSSSTNSAVITESSTSSTAGLIQHQHKAVSSANIVTTEKHYQQKSTSTKGKFQSFLQHPDSSPGASHFGSSFLTAQQKHVRQFVRSTSAHSETGVGTAAGGAAGSASAVAGNNGKPEKYIRSASAQIDDSTDVQLSSYSGGASSANIEQTAITKGLQQSSSILISKSAETIETVKSLTTASSSMRTHLTLSGNFLAPPNRKLTILSPIHAPPGLHDMLKRHGRSPLSPRISFPGSDGDLFP